jgi:hypothetical protein
MNIQKLVIIAAAILINVLMLAGFNAWTVAAVASAAAHPAPGEKILTLPAIQVAPSAAQLRALGRSAPGHAAPSQSNAGGGAACVEMPFYSYAAPCADDVVG